jgi:hypothetical protein
LRAGAIIVINAARGLAPILMSRYANDPRRSPGTLQRAIVAVPTRRGDHPDEVVVIVGVRMLSKGSIRKYKDATGRSGASNPKDPFYWWYVEKGTRGHKRRQVSIPGTRFLKRGFEDNAARAAQEIKTKAAAEVVRFGNTLAR